GYTSLGEGGESNTATVTVTVNPPAPKCNAVAQSAAAGRPRSITLSCAPVPKYALVDAPAHGKLSGFDADAGTVVYTADDAYKGAATFTYMATNAGGESAPATVTLDVAERPGMTSTPSPGVVLGGSLTDTVTVNPRFEPKPGATVEFRLYAGTDCTGTP